MWAMESLHLKFGSASGAKRSWRFCDLRSQCSSINLPEHSIERSDDGGNVGQHVAARQEVHRRKMRKGGRADLALVGPAGPIRNKIHTKFTLGSLDRGADLSGRHPAAFGIALEAFDH